MPRRLTFAALLAPLALLTPASPARGDVAIATLHWTATGDDGRVGRAARYDLRRSSQPINEANFVAADTVGSAPVPSPSGTSEAVTVIVPTVGVPWYFAVRAADESGNWSALSNVATWTAPVLGVDAPVAALALSTPWPNPASNRATLRFEGPASADVDVTIYDATGRRVRALWAGPLPEGRRLFTWDLRDAAGAQVPDGVYFVRARCESGTRVRRLVVGR